MVQVVGEVRRLGIAEADAEAGSDLDEERFGGLEEVPAVYADDVVLEPVG